MNFQVINQQTKEIILDIDTSLLLFKPQQIAGTDLIIYAYFKPSTPKFEDEEE